MTTTTTQSGSQAGTIGFDIGGTKIAAGVISARGTIIERLITDTPHTHDQTRFMDVLRAIADTLRKNHPGVESIGVGAAGVVDWRTGRIRWAPNNTYQDLALGDALAAHTGLPVIVENDANTAAVAEGRIGGGAGFHTAIVLTVGTGIGGGLVLDGQPYRGSSGIASEVGHTHLQPRGGPRCGCGATGCLEALASGRALARAAQGAAHAYPGSLIARIAGTPEAATGRIVHQAALRGDPHANALFQEMGYWLGVGIATLVNILDPEIVVLGGGIPATVGDLLLAPVRESFHQFVFAGSHRKLPAIVPARLGPDAGLIGAAMLAADLEFTQQKT